MDTKLKARHLYSVQDYVDLVNQNPLIKVDQPALFVSRIVLNDPANGNRIGNVMRAQMLHQLILNDQNPNIRVTIICGEGPDFCAGKDVNGSKGALPFFTNDSDGRLARNIVEGWFLVMDLAKPVIAMVRGKCLGSGMELVAACDIVVCTEDCQIGYPEGRSMGLPDMQIYPWLCGMRNSLSIMLLGEIMDGPSSVRRGFSTLSVPKEKLVETTMRLAERVAKIPSDLLAYNKRSVHRAFEAQGMRANLRHGVDLESLMYHGPSGSTLVRAEQQPDRKNRKKPSQIRVKPTNVNSKL